MKRFFRWLNLCDFFNGHTDNYYVLFPGHDLRLNTCRRCGANAHLDFKA